MGYIEFETSNGERVFLSLSEIEGVYEVREGENKYCAISSRYVTYRCLSYDEIIQKIREVKEGSIQDKFIKLHIVNADNDENFSYEKASRILSINDCTDYRTVFFDNGDSLDVRNSAESILEAIGYKLQRVK